MTKFTFIHVDRPGHGTCGWCGSSLEGRADFYFNYRKEATVKLLCAECAETEIARKAHYMTKTHETRFEAPDTARRSTCKCGAEMLWITTARGKPMPLDLASARREEDGRMTYLSHFATCPNAAQFRKAGT